MKAALVPLVRVGLLLSWCVVGLTLAGACIYASVALGLAFLREVLRGSASREGEYESINEAGPSSGAVILFGVFEACFYLAIYFSYWGAALIVWILPLAIIIFEASMLLNRTNLRFTAAGIEVSRITEDHIFAWSNLELLHGPTHITLRDDSERIRVRLGAAQLERFLDEHARGAARNQSAEAPGDSSETRIP